MPNIMLYEKKDLWEEVKKGFKPRYLKCKPIPFKIIAKFDKGQFKNFEKDPLLYQNIRDPLPKIANDMIKEIRKHAQKTDNLTSNLLSELIDGQDRAKQIEENSKKFEILMTKSIEKLNSVMKQECIKGWKNFQAKKKEYKTFTLKLVTDNAVRAGGVIMGLAGLVGTFGIGTVASIQTIVKSVAGILKSTIAALGNLDKLMKDIKKSLDGLSKKLNSAGGEAANATQQVMEGVIGYAGTTVTGLEKDLAGFKGNYQRFDLDCNKMSAQLQNALKSCDMLKRELSKKHYETAAAPIEKEISGLVSKISENQAKVREYEKFHAHAMKLIKKLQLLPSVKGSAKFSKILGTLVDLTKSTIAIVGITAGIVKGVKSALEMAAKTIRALVNMAGQLYNNLNAHSKVVSKAVASVAAAT